MIRYGEERYETRELQERVRDRFSQLRHHDARDGIVPWHVVNANQTMDQVQDDINTIVQRVLDDLDDAPDTPVHSLWTTTTNNKTNTSTKPRFSKVLMSSSYKENQEPLLGETD